MAEHSQNSDPFAIFVYKGSRWPVAFARVQVLPPAGIKWQQPDPVFKSRTSGDGILDTKDPEWLKVYQTLQPLIVKPQYGHGPLLCEIFDDVKGQSEVHSFNGGIKPVGWERPAPLADFDGNVFSDPVEYAQFLCDRYIRLSNFKVNLIPITLFRCGSPAPFPDFDDTFRELERWLEQVLTAGDAAMAARKRQMHRLKMQIFSGGAVEEVSKILRLPKTRSVPDTYAAILKQMVEISRSVFRPRSPIESKQGNHTLKQLINALMRVFEQKQTFQPVVMPGEDVAALATLLFFCGCIAHGFTRGTVHIRRPDDLLKIHVEVR